MRSGILAGGNWIVDRVKIIDRWPAQDALASILRQSSSSGGSPYNILIDLARLGASFPLAGVGLVGDDEAGRGIVAHCREHKIDTAQIRVTREAPTSYTDVMTVASTGRRTFFHQRGANAFLDGIHFDFSATNARIFHLGYLLLLDRLDELANDETRACDVLRRAGEAGLMTSIDCVSEDSNRFESLVSPALPHVDVLFANDFEAEKLTGVPLRDRDRITSAPVGRAAQKLLKRGVRQWVVVHFPEAVHACHSSGKTLWQPSVRISADQIAGAAGAGDALAAGVLMGLHDGKPMDECLRLGVAAAAASLGHPTCTEGVKSAAECLADAERRGFRPLPA